MNPVLTGSNIKVVSRASLQGNLKDAASPDGGEQTKVYIQIPQSNEKKTIYNSGNISIQVSDKSDKNHNKVKKPSSYEKRRDSSTELGFDESKTKTNGQTQVQRPSSTVVSSSTEINDEQDEINNDNSSDSLEAPEKMSKVSGHDGEGAMFGRVTLQPQPAQSFWQGGAHHAHKERPTPYSTSTLADRTYKQIARSRKFK